MDGVGFAELAVFLDLDTVGIVLLVLERVVVPLLAYGARESYLVSAGVSHYQPPCYLLFCTCRRTKKEHPAFRVLFIITDTANESQAFCAAASKISAKKYRAGGAALLCVPRGASESVFLRISYEKT